MIEKVLNVLGGLSPDQVRWGSKMAGALWYALDRRHREVAVQNIRLAFGGTDAECRALARENFIHLARVFLEVPRMARIGPDNYRQFVEPHGVDLVEKSLRLGKGVLFLTGHFGNWEWMAYCSALYLPAPCNAVARHVNPPWLNDALSSLRQRSGNRIIDKRDGPEPILKALRGNELVGILLDQNAGVETAVFAPFFGGFVPTHRAMALLALKSGAPVHPFFNWRDSSGKYHIEFHPALALPSTGSLRERIFESTALFNQCLEAQIRRFPSQWYWIHRRFRHYSREPGLRDRKSPGLPGCIPDPFRPVSR